MTDRITAAEFRKAQQAKSKAKRIDREGPIHLECLHWLQMQFPDALIHHSPNETDLSGRDTGSGGRNPVAAAISKQKDLGMVPGFPDLLVIWQGHVWGIEVKAPAGKVTMAQEEVGMKMVANGTRWAVVRSLDELKEVVAVWRQDVVFRAEHRGEVS